MPMHLIQIADSWRAQNLTRDDNHAAPSFVNRFITDSRHSFLVHWAWLSATKQLAIAMHLLFAEFNFEDLLFFFARFIQYLSLLITSIVLCRLFD